MYDNTLGRWFGVDQLAEAYSTYSPFSYALNNPMRFVDVLGLYPEEILTKKGNAYYFKPAAAYLLALVTGAPYSQIQQIRNMEPYTFLGKSVLPPEGFGGITLGMFNTASSSIFYHKDFFDDSKGFGQNIGVWLSMASHEVSHTNQIGALTGGLYLSSYLGDWILSGFDYDRMKMEEYADERQTIFKNFYKHLDSKFGNGILDALFRCGMSQDAMMIMIDRWWGDWNSQNSSKSVSWGTVINDWGEGTYKWDGSAWVKQ